MKFVSVQPATNYYIWQLEVLIKSAMDNKYQLNDFIFLLVRPNKYPFSNVVKKFISRYPNNCIIYDDDRTDKLYIPSIRLNVLAKFIKEYRCKCKKNKQLVDHIFYHDADIAFTKYFDFNQLVKDSKTVYVSDTRSYIGAKYINSISPDLLMRMANIVGINPKVIEYNQDRSGGCQYIIPKGLLNSDFFIKCEKDSTELYRLLQTTKIQSWTSDMWSILWNLWLNNINTEISPELEFAWFHWEVTKWNQVNIYHNAGVVDSRKYFNKTDFITELPFGKDFSKYKADNCSTEYVKIIDSLHHLSDEYRFH